MAFLLTAMYLSAQNESCYYDSAGNRISRTVVVPALRSAPANNKEEDMVPFREQFFKDLQIKIYPNPVQGLLQVDFQGIDFTGDDNKAEISLFGSKGQMLLQCKVISPFTSVDLSNYPEGIYILRLTVNGKSAECKIIKR